jgi:hypothetical protein
MIEDQHQQEISLEEAESQVHSSFTLLLQVLINNSCIAHVINLVTQMFSSTYSKSPHFDPKQPDAHIPTSCNEVRLVRAIVVKVQISYLS